MISPRMKWEVRFSVGGEGSGSRCLDSFDILHIDKAKNKYAKSRRFIALAYIEKKAMRFKNE